MQRCTRQEKSPPPLLFALLTEFLEVPHLADGRAPLHQQPLVQAPPGLKRRRPRLERHRVARHGREVPVVQPAHGGFVALQPDRAGVFLRPFFAVLWAGVAVGGLC